MGPIKEIPLQVKVSKVKQAPIDGGIFHQQIIV